MTEPADIVDVARTAADAASGTLPASVIGVAVFVLSAGNQFGVASTIDQARLGDIMRDWLARSTAELSDGRRLH
jgi:hypothetical protein